jgi:thiamine-monophosphate kinase
MAAMAAVPRFALLGLSAPANFHVKTLEEILEGFLEKADEAGVTLMGGDVTGADKLFLSVTLLGDAKPPAPVYRSGARPGDHIYVTGHLGDSALGLNRLLQLDALPEIEKISSIPFSAAIMRHMDPEPRLAAGRKLAGTATSMIDLSDGIASDLPRLIKESRVAGAQIEINRLPLSEEFREHYRAEQGIGGEALQAALAGGEDYELLFTVPPEWNGDGKIKELEGTGITRIGEMADTPGIVLYDAGGGRVELPKDLFSHFEDPAEGGHV